MAHAARWDPTGSLRRVFHMTVLTTDLRLVFGPQGFDSLWLLWMTVHTLSIA